MCRLRFVLRVSALALFLPIALDPAVAAQGELVIHKDGTKLYHRPHCPVVRDMKGVIALTREQADARGYKPHPDCDPANPEAAAARDARLSESTVDLDGTKYYHRKTCKRADAAKLEAAPLESAGKTHWPCPVCKPPIRRKQAK